MKGGWRRVLGWLGAVLSICIASGPVVAADQPMLTVFAAASMTDAMQAAGRAYTARTGQRVRFSFAASGTIARQLAAGAPADLFVSADPKWMDQAERQRLIDPRSRTNIAEGRLVLITPKANTLTIKIRPGFPLMAALGENGRVAIGDPDYVPAGQYARTALMRMGVWKQVAGRLARADNVRVALAYVARGEAPLGIVYETDAAIEPDVRIAGVFPPASHPPIVYPAATTPKAKPGAARFLKFLRGPRGRAILQHYRFRA